jgi:hypothetical protein
MAQVRFMDKNRIKKQISAKNIADILQIGKIKKCIEIKVLIKYLFQNLICDQIGWFYPIHTQSS